MAGSDEAVSGKMRIWRNARLATLAENRPGLGIVENGAIAARDGRIVFAGPEADMPAGLRNGAEIVDCAGRWITPGLIDCHTHLVHAGNRANEFEMRLAGASYEEIARAGGGIVSSVKALRAASEDELVAQSLAAARRADRRRRHDGRDQVGLRARPRERDEDRCRRRAALGERTRRLRFAPPSSAPMRCRRKPPATRTPISISSPTQMLPAIAAAGLADAVDAFCEGIAFSPEQIARVFEAARALGLPVKLHADQLSDLGTARRLPPASARCRPTISNTPTKPAPSPWPRPAPSRCCCPAPSISSARRKKPPIDLFRGYGVQMALATDCNPGTSPLTSLLLTMNMAATLFRLTVDECLAGVTREAARALGLLDEIGTLEAGKCGDLAIWDIEQPGRTCLPHGLQSAACARLEGPMTELVLKPGQCDACRLARHLSRRGAEARSGLPAAGSRRAPPTVARIVAKGEPVYGINTGFGKLASVRIPASDLATLQRNIVLSHAAGVGEPMPVPIARLMMALKLASLAQGASGVQPETIALLEAMLASDVTPVVPAQGSVGASGDLAPLAHMAAAMIGVGECFTPHGRVPAKVALRLARAGAADAGRQGRAGAAQRHAVLDRLRAGRRCSRPRCCSSRRWSPARCRPTPPRAPTRRSIRASMRCAATRARSRRRRRCAS